MKATLLFPHQLYRQGSHLENENEIYLIEEFLYFRQYKFHKQKIAFHRSTMKSFADHLESIGKTIHYIDSNTTLSDSREFGVEIQNKGITEIHLIQPDDDWLEQRLLAVTRDIKVHWHSNPSFLNTTTELGSFFRKDKKSYFQTSFYKQQRKKWSLLLDANNDPLGGKWTYDSENRKKYPKNRTPPAIHPPSWTSFHQEAAEYTEAYFQDHLGTLSQQIIYPVDPEQASQWLDQFLEYRFHDFGAYEDAIVKEHLLLNHSLLSPLINVGLLSPLEVVNRAVNFAIERDIPINSTEGFVRQIIGWREFIRGMYWSKGRYSRTRNFWNFSRPIPSSFYDGTTGIAPVDETIRKVLKTGYCHHIERLMILGNFMLLCEFDPDEVYQWFMELFIDAYDWVMVPNVYGMCLFADGGTFATKPYIGGSNYLRKMSNYEKGNWQEIWDGLFWRFVIVHGDFFRSNPRTSMLWYSLQKMSSDKRETHLENGNRFLAAL